MRSPCDYTWITHAKLSFYGVQWVGWQPTEWHEKKSLLFWNNGSASVTHIKMCTQWYFLLWCEMNNHPMFKSHHKTEDWNTLCKTCVLWICRFIVLSNLNFLGHPSTVQLERENHKMLTCKGSFKQFSKKLIRVILVKVVTRPSIKILRVHAYLSSKVFFEWEIMCLCACDFELNFLSHR